MSVESVIASEILADPGIAAMIQGRLFVGLADQGSQFPRVTYSMSGGGSEVFDLRGPSGLAEVRVQIDSWARSYSQVRRLADMVRDALTGRAGIGEVLLIQVVGPAQIGIEPPTAAGQRPIHRAKLDFSVSYRVPRVNRYQQ